LIFYLSYFFFIPIFFELETFLQKMSVGFSVVVFAYFSLLFSYHWFQKCKEVKGFFTFSWLKKEEQHELISLHQSCKNWLMKNIVLK
jgi:hypothetical protein